MAQNKPALPQSAQSIVDSDGKMTDQFRFWVQKVNENQVIIGTGNPEGVLDATLYTLYIDETTPTSPVQYRKMLAEIGGDKLKGWVAL